MSDMLAREKITAEQLGRRAIVFVRQSTPGQVAHNQESRRLQYAIVDKARDLGFANVEVIDDDLGRSGSGMVARPGFDALVGAVCTSEVGAIFSIEDSRLARNGRQWHHLIELCALTGTLLVDPNGIYDPRLINDRLVLGLKGSMAEFELGLIRQRSYAAIREKASRGELRIALPVGLRWTEHGKIELDPDERVQKAIHSVFRKHMEVGSIHQILVWYRRENITLPTYTFDRSCKTATWRLPSYQTIHGILTNPMYAGAYAFGRREIRVQLIDGIPRKTDGHMKPRARWSVLIRDHHPGYIGWERYEEHQSMIADNAHKYSRGSRKAARGGRCLLVGLLRCRRCGRMLSVMYKGNTHRVPRYVCAHALKNDGTQRCISFGGLRPDEVVAAELLRPLDRRAVEAALRAHELLAKQGDDQEQALELELKQAHYEAQLAARRYDAVDPSQRLVAAELEARWNASLERVQQIERSLDQHRGETAHQPTASLDTLMTLADDLPAIWNDPAADMRIKQRIVRTLIHEIVADVDGTTNEIVLIIHWTGGRHSEVRIPKNKAGHTSRWTDPDAEKIICAMAGAWSDRDIALTLNRLRLRTGTRQTWTQSRVRSVRHRMKLPAYDPNQAERTSLSLDQAAAYLGVSTTTVRRLIHEKVIPAIQVVPGAPWQLRRDTLDAPQVRKALDAPRRRFARSRTTTPNDRTPMIPGLNGGGA
jgi:excisionase family DNA binding protein